MSERDKDKLETLYAGLPSNLQSPSVILAVIELVIALKKLYDLLHKNERVKLFAAPDTAEPLCWTVLGGEEEKQEEKEEE